MKCRTACHSTKVPQPLELELKVVVSHLWWVLDLNSGSSLCSWLSHLSSPRRHAIANLWVLCSFFPLKTFSLPAPSPWVVSAACLFPKMYWPPKLQRDLPMAAFGGGLNVSAQVHLWSFSNPRHEQREIWAEACLLFFSIWTLNCFSSGWWKSFVLVSLQ